MRAFKTVFLFHLKENISSKMFIIMTIVLMGLVLGFFAFTHYSSDRGISHIGIANETTSYNVPLKELNKKHKSFDLKAVNKNNIKKYKNKVKNNDRDGLIVITEQNGFPTVTYYYNTFADYEITSIIQQVVQQTYLQKTIHDKHVDPSVAKALLTTITVQDKALKSNDSMGLVYFFIFMMYMFILTCGQVVSMSVSSEKTSRVMEIMITKVRPIVMMYGKIFSSMSMGIAYIASIGIAYLIAQQLGWTGSDSLSIFGMPLDLSVLTFNLFLSFLVYFILGYVLFAFLFASLSSVVSRLEDLGSVIFPASILMMGAFFLGIRAMTDPTDKWAVIGSYIPFFSPVVMFTRIVLEAATPMEIGISIVILLATIVVISLLASRLYLNGVMRYSGKTTFKDVWKMIKK